MITAKYMAITQEMNNLVLCLQLRAVYSSDLQLYTAPHEGDTSNFYSYIPFHLRVCGVQHFDSSKQSSIIQIFNKLLDAGFNGVTLPSNAGVIASNLEHIEQI